MAKKNSRIINDRAYWRVTSRKHKDKKWIESYKEELKKTGHYLCVLDKDKDGYFLWVANKNAKNKKSTNPQNRVYPRTRKQWAEFRSRSSGSY